MLSEDDLKDLEKRVNNSELSKDVIETNNSIQFVYMDNQLFRVKGNALQPVDYLRLNQIYAILDEIYNQNL